VKGHPIHQILVPLPIGLLVGAFGFHVAGRLLDDPTLWTIGGYLVPAGVATGLLAGVFGFVDYLWAVPPRSSGRTRATRHMLANLSALALFVAASFLRGEPSAEPGALVLLLEAVGLAALSAGGWMGGTLVTRNFIGPEHRYAGAGRWKDESVRESAGGPVVVARADELQRDQMKLLRVDGRRIVLARTEEGHVAFDDSCTHRGGSLADGVMICGRVQCLWHGSQFDVSTGAVHAGPAERPIGTYALEESGGEVRLLLDESGGPRPAGGRPKAAAGS
jgi:nitrite reductase/ring-hydroxylating ferredoxin subunit/uncharacterized membrane protein